MIYIEEYIERQTPENQLILHTLREIILSTDELIEEKFKYKIPYYHYNKKSLCYLTVNKNGAVDLGFAKGYLLADSFGILESQHLKIVRHLKYNHAEQIEIEPIISYLQQSIQLIINHKKTRIPQN